MSFLYPCEVLGRVIMSMGKEYNILMRGAGTNLKHIFFCFGKTVL